MQQQNDDDQDPEEETRPWRISAGWLIQIELAWLVASAFIGWYLDSLPSEHWAAQAYQTLAGGNILGLFVLVNAAGYLIYEEIRMVLSGIHRKEMIAKAVNKAVRAAVKEAVAAERAAAEETRQAERAAAEETRQAERAAERAAVAAWYERQRAAQREGRPFDEPPPGYGNPSNGSNPAS